MTDTIVLLSPNPACPTCGSRHTELQKVGELTGMLAGGVVGVAALTLARIALRGPMLPFSLLGLLIGVAAWAKGGKEIGAQVDTVLLRKYQCQSCGCHFED